MSPGKPCPSLAATGNSLWDNLEIIPKIVVRAGVNHLVYPFLDNEWPVQNFRDFVCWSLRRPDAPLFNTTERYLISHE